MSSQEKLPVAGCTANRGRPVGRPANVSRHEPHEPGAESAQPAAQARSASTCHGKGWKTGRSSLERCNAWSIEMLSLADRSAAATVAERSRRPGGINGERQQFVIGTLGHRRAVY